MQGGAVRHTLLDQLENETEKLKKEKLLKAERVIASQQQADITVAGSESVLILCANNFLGLANHPELNRAARDSGSILVEESCN